MEIYVRVQPLAHTQLASRWWRSDCTTRLHHNVMMPNVLLEQGGAGGRRQAFPCRAEVLELLGSIGDSVARRAGQLPPDRLAAALRACAVATAAAPPRVWVSYKAPPPNRATHGYLI